MVQLIVLLALLSTVRASKNLSFIFITTYGPNGINVSGVVPALEMAVRDINNRQDLLSGFNLTYSKVQDSMCLYNISLKAFFSEILSGPVKLAVIGCGCSVATQPVAAISHFWNISQISYLSASPALSDRSIYKKFFRLHDSNLIDYPAFYSMMHHFGWKRIGVLTQKEDIFILAELNLRKVLENEAYTVQSHIFETASDPLLSIKDLFFHEDDYRIFFLNCYSGPARKILCQAAKLGYSYPKYAWILNDWYTTNWWTAAEDHGTVNCTDEDLKRFLDKTISVHSFPAVRDPEAAGLNTTAPFLTEYETRCNKEKYYTTDDGGRTYDSIWVLAMALNSTMAMYKSGNINGTGCENMRGSLVPLDQFDYSNEKMGCLIQWNIQRTNFAGVTGRIQFDKTGTRIQKTIWAKQYRIDSRGNLSRILFASFSIDDNYTWNYLPNNSDVTVYPEGIPSDGIPIKKVDLLSIPTVAVLDTMVTCGLIFTIVCFSFNYGYRRKSIVRLSSSNLNYIILIGATLMYTSIYFYLIRTHTESIVKIMCNLKEWLFTVGYSLCFGTVLVKMLRIYTIFQNPTAKKKILFQDWHLMLMVAVIVGIGMLLLIVETAISYLTESITTEENRENPKGVSAGSGVRTVNLVFVCHKTSSPCSYWRVVIVVYLAVLQLFGIILAFQTRKVKFPGLNDSKFVGAIIYISSIVLVIMAMDSFLLSNYLNIYGVTYSIGIFILTTIFLSLTFIPRMVMLYKNTEPSSTSGVSVSGPDREMASTTISPDVDAQIASLQETIKKMKSVISSQEMEINALRKGRQDDG